MSVVLILLNVYSLSIDIDWSANSAQPYIFSVGIIIYFSLIYLVLREDVDKAAGELRGDSTLS